MKNCPKCGFKILDPSMNACPKCGVVFEKVRRRSEEQYAKEKVSSSAEEILGFQEETRKKYLDWEYSVDAMTEKRKYPFADNLSFVVIFLTIIWVIADVIGLLILNELFAYLPFRERIYILIAVAIAAAYGIVVFLSISAFLIMQVEIAKNTWASREYLRRICDGMDLEK